MDDIGVATRLQTLRKLRGVTQATLAQRAHVSLSLVKKVEQGSAPPTPAFVAQAARALGVKPGYLYGTEQYDAREPSWNEAPGIADLRTAVDAYDDPQPAGEPLPLEYIDARLTEIAGQVFRLRYDQAAAELAGLLHHLYVLVAEPDPTGVLARAALHDAYRLTATVAGRFRQLDLAATASERHIQLAPFTGDPHRVAVSAFHRSSRHLQNGDYRAGLRLIERAREHVDSTETGRALQVQLDLRSAVLAARAGDLPEADEYLQEARALQEAEPIPLPMTPYRGLDSSATNTLVHWVAAPVELGDGTESVRRSGLVEIVDRDRPERVGHYYIDLSRAYVLHGDAGRALEALDKARRIDPHNTRRHPTVRETVLALAKGKRPPEALSDFATWAGIDS
ncbi:helix-turn-helix transcriptional regulator [Kribbella sp. NPDC051137]|uniref:helix-turn-helix transcriptional regulator n=1 Tax=Kribbella sp. NPDC051137 TaxID=3155045 RepID=UPI003439ADBD